MKQYKAALVGAGNRGCVYSDYSLECPQELVIVAVVEPDDIRRNAAGERYHIEENKRFKDLTEFLNAQITCDFVINATMDELHYATAKAIMLAGYNMLLEKPIVSNEKELFDLQRIANEKQVKVNVCHVLRYTPFYKRIKTIINSGKIGKIMTMELCEHVGIAHFLDSFVRGKWKSEKNCGSGFLLQKSCHDMDLICWLNNATEPKKLSCVGSRALFTKENMPAGATKYCYDCPYNESCLYSAQKVHLEVDSMPFQTWVGLGKPIDKITKEEKALHLKTSEYGLCAYDSGGDITDRQVVCIEFEDGSTAAFTMVGATPRAGRKIHICGTHGEIDGWLEDGKFILRLFDRSGSEWRCVDEEIDVHSEVHNSVQYGGHGGGDYAIMHELLRYLDGDDSSVSITNLNDSINGHRVVYLAEEARKLNKTLEFKN